MWQCQLLQVSTAQEYTFPSLFFYSHFLFHSLILSVVLSLSSSLRCFCKDCLNILVGDGTFDKLKDVDPWSCFMCLPSQCNGSLKLRTDWSVRVQEFFVNNSALEFEPHRVYPSIPAHQRRPIRVLSLFDGIATGLYILNMGFHLSLGDGCR